MTYDYRTASKYDGLSPFVVEFTLKSVERWVFEKARPSLAEAKKVADKVAKNDKLRARVIDRDSSKVLYET
jgi:hypothetical protein